MPNRKDVERVARSWVHTPYAHLGRVKGVSADCVCLPIMIAKELQIPGTEEFVDTPYSRIPDGKRLVSTCKKFLHEIEFDKRQPLANICRGDILVMAFKRHPMHTAIVCWHAAGRYHTIVHALRANNEVVEACLDNEWLQRIKHVFRYPGMT